jgi:hypothetical protein
MSISAAWNKRLRAPTLRGIAQNHSLGARYFRVDHLSSSYGFPGDNALVDACDVLEEIANRGRCIVVLPDESRLGLYFVEPEAGESQLVWYEPRRLLPPADNSHHWAVTLEVVGTRAEDAFKRSHRSRIEEALDD